MEMTIQRSCEMSSLKWRLGISQTKRAIFVHCGLSTIIVTNHMRELWAKELTEDAAEEYFTVETVTDTGQLVV